MYSNAIGKNRVACVCSDILRVLVAPAPYLLRGLFGFSSGIPEGTPKRLREFPKKPRRNPEGCPKQVRRWYEGSPKDVRKIPEGSISKERTNNGLTTD